MKKGWVYFIQAEKGTPVKIGYTLDPLDRLKNLQVGNPLRLSVVASFPGTREEERFLHREFSEHRMEGEWFADCPAIQAQIRHYGMSDADHLLAELA